MKNLYESLLDDFEKLEDSMDPIKEIKQFLNDNYDGIQKVKISKKPNKDGYYEVNCGNRKKGFIEVKNKEIESLTNGMFVFTNVWNFMCMGCNNLTSFKGISKEVGGNFNCLRCNKLTSLEGAPEKVGIFCCFDCNN